MVEEDAEDEAALEQVLEEGVRHPRPALAQRDHRLPHQVVLAARRRRAVPHVDDDLRERARPHVEVEALVPARRRAADARRRAPRAPAVSSHSATTTYGSRGAPPGRDGSPSASSTRTLGASPAGSPRPPPPRRATRAPVCEGGQRRSVIIAQNDAERAPASCLGVGLGELEPRAQDLDGAVGGHHRAVVRVFAHWRACAVAGSCRPERCRRHVITVLLGQRCGARLARRAGRARANAQGPQAAKAAHQKRR